MHMHRAQLYREHREVVRMEFRVFMRKCESETKVFLHKCK